MRPIPTPSPRALRAIVAVLLVAGLAAMPLVDDDDNEGPRLATVGGPPDAVEVTPDEVVDTVVAVPPAPDTDEAGVLPKVSRPRLPKVTVPPVTTPTLPTVALPQFGDERARAACVAARGGAPVAGTLLADSGAYVAAPDGSGVRHMSRSDDAGTWDPARRRLAYQVYFQSERLVLSALCVSEGTEARLVGVLDTGGCCMAPGAAQLWTAGDRLAAVDTTVRPSVLRLHDPRGGQSTASFPLNRAWDLSPDGRTVAFVHGNGPPGEEIRLADLATGSVRTLTRLDGDAFTAWMVRWLPDGSGVAFTTDGLHVVDVATGRRRKLLDAPVGQYAFAPDGRLAYTTYLRGEDHGHVYVTRPDGSAPLEVGDGPVRWLAWSPQGDRLLLASGRRNDASLEIVGADGKGRRTLLRAAARPGEHWLRFVLNTGWSPDGSRIEFGLIRDPAVDAVAGVG